MPSSKKSRRSAQVARKLPVTILTGFLGSGKTTLLNHILTDASHGMKFAVIENEFGEVGVDDALIKKFNTEENVIEMNNGCICCTVRGDLIRILKEVILPRRSEFNGIIIETTGLADPAPVAQTFFVDDHIEKLCRLDGIITVVDCKHVLQHLDEEKPEGVENECVEQVAFADRILLNKTDLVSTDEVAVLRERLHSINARADIIECQYSKVDPSLLLNIKGFDLNTVLQMDPEFLSEGDHQHDQRVTSVGFRSQDAMNIADLEGWIMELLNTKGTDLLRYKGVINVAGMDQKFVFQGVHMLFGGGFGEAWGKDEERESRFIFIGKNLDRAELTEGFMACKAQPLRFKAGDRVEAKVTRGFAPGTVIGTWDEGNPYRIKLDNGTEVWGPADDDTVVRAITPPSA